ncbi:MAG: LLM class F420-dependent oxidoreductase [Candidatus Dormibacteraceae bacterium]
MFPQTESGSDPRFPRRYAQAMEAAGYRHLVAYDHVLGHRPDDLEAWLRLGPYTARDQFHEILTLFAYLAACTDRLELATEVLVLPQRTTAVAAKQAAEIAILSGGRLRLGVGIGWNPVEFEGLGARFDDRGSRVEEQVGLLRRLLREPVVTYEGRWHRLVACGVNPLPPPIPIWMGGSAEAALRRTARIADGLMLNHGLLEAPGVIERVRGHLAEVGRDPSGFGFAGRMPLQAGDARGSLEGSLERARRWRAAGVTHLSIGTMGIGLESPDAHLDLALRFKEAWDAAAGG